MYGWKALLVFGLAACACLAQSREPDDSWLMKNYRFAGVPAPGEIPQVSPTVAQLEEIQNTVLSILRKADFASDFEAALAAAAQATANAQLMGAVTGQLKPPQPPAPGPRDQNPPGPAKYLIALRDRSIEAASAVWMDRLMLHYLTPGGAHVQVRLDQVDWQRSAELSRRSDSCRTVNWFSCTPCGARHICITR